MVLVVTLLCHMSVQDRLQVVVLLDRLAQPRGGELCFFGDGVPGFDVGDEIDHCIPGGILGVPPLLLT